MNQPNDSVKLFRTAAGTQKKEERTAFAETLFFSSILPIFYKI
jgi:hypothetical protein